MNSVTLKRGPTLSSTSVLRIALTYGVTNKLPLFGVWNIYFVPDLSKNIEKSLYWAATWVDNQCTPKQRDF